MANELKSQLLGMPFGTASHKLRTSIMFRLVQLAKLDKCFICNEVIATEKTLSIEHKIPWQGSDDPVQRFFDIENIAFSHRACNRRVVPPTCQAGHSLTGGRCRSCKRTYDRAFWHTNGKAAKRKQRRHASASSNGKKNGC